MDPLVIAPAVALVVIALLGVLALVERSSRRSTSRRQPPQGAVLGVSLLLYLVQSMVLAGTFLMGLGWGGFTWLAALLQAGAGFGAIAWLAKRRTWLILAVPVLSAALTFGLVTLGGALGDVGV